MFDVTDLLRRQAKWQKSLRDLPWPAKIRMAAALRDAALQLSKAKSSERRRDEGDGTRVP